MEGKYWEMTLGSCGDNSVFFEFFSHRMNHAANDWIRVQQMDDPSSDPTM